MNVLQTIDLKKYYGSEPNVTRALDGDTADERFIDEIVEMLALEDRLMNMPNNLSGGQMRGDRPLPRRGRQARKGGGRS